MPLADFELCALDVDQLVTSLSAAGEFYLFNCWCGIPACVGLSAGVQVTHAGQGADATVVWTLTQPEEHAGRYVFAAAQVAQAVADLLALLQHHAAHAPPTPAGRAGRRCKPPLSIVPPGNERYLSVPRLA